MRRFLLWSGGAILVVVLLIVLAAQLYPKHVACERFAQGYVSGVAPEATSTPVSADWYVLADCQGVQSDLYMTYYIIALGVALLGTGFVIRR